MKNPNKIHQVLKPIVKPTSKLFRQITLEKFEDLLETKTHYFARLDRFDDLLEGVLGRTSLDSIINDKRLDEKGLDEQYKNWQIELAEKRQRVYLNCWQLKNFPEPKGWLEYTQKNPKSIAIETTFEQLKNSFIETEIINVMPVTYVDEDFEDQNRVINPHHYKRKEFSWENEIRCEFHLPYQIELHSSPQEKRIKVDLNKLINKIHFSPFSKDNFSYEIQDMCREYDFSIGMNN